MRGSLQHEVVYSIIDNCSFDEVVAFYEHLNIRRIDLKQELETSLFQYVAELIEEEEIMTKTNMLKKVTADKVSIYFDTGIKLQVKFYEEGHMIHLVFGSGINVFVDLDADISQYDKSIQELLKIWLPLARNISNKRKELGGVVEENK